MLPLRDRERSRSLPVMTWLLIAANVLVFLFELSLEPNQLVALSRSLGLVPARLVAQPGLGEGLTIVTSMFLHGGWWHLISNMWVLYIFGDNVEDRMGHLRYLLFYLLAGVAGAAAHVLANASSSVPTVGASGAISGIMGAYLLLFPQARVITLIPGPLLPRLIEVPALVFIGFWFVSQLFSGLFALSAEGAVQAYGGVAWWAHVGGFVAGALLVRRFARRRYRPSYGNEAWRW